MIVDDALMARAVTVACVSDEHPTAPDPTSEAGSRLLQAKESHTVRAAGLASAQLAANALALAATVAFARALGTDDYGELARMVSVFTILLVPASALQAAAARDAALGALGPKPQTAATLRRWIGRILLATAATFLLCALLREQLADLMQVSTPWAAALVLPAGVLWTALALQRGVLQGLGDYRPVALSLIIEQGARLTLGLGAILAGGSIGLIFALSVPLAIVPVLLWLAAVTRRELGPSTRQPANLPLRALARRNPVPVAALTLFAVVQNADVVAVAHRFPSSLSGAYAEAAVAAKGVVWVAVGLGLYLLPETTREVSAGRDARHLLGRTSGLLALVAVPMVIVYAVAGGPLLRVVFGDKAELAANALPWLGAAMSLLSITYLTLQFSLGLGRRAFVALMALAAAAVPATVALAGDSLKSVSIGLLVLNALLAAGMLVLALRPGPANPSPPDPDEATALALAETSAAAEAAII